jgi:hypothetical protein
MPLPRLPLAVCLCLFASSVRSATAPPPAVIWKLDQTAAIGGHPATVLGHPSVVTDSEGPALYFNGTNDGLLLPINPLAGLAEFTIEVLFKPASGGPAEQRFLHVQDEPGSRALMEIRLLDTGWALDTFLYSLKTKSQHPLLDRTRLHPADQWTWVALAYAHGHMVHSINGVKELEGDVDFPPTLAGQISLGVRQNKVYWFKGAIREVRFHPVALAGEQLQGAGAK